MMYQNPKFVRYVSRQMLAAKLTNTYWTLVDVSRDDFNDSVLRERFTNAIEHIMKQQVALRNIVQFSVVCDESNNHPSYIELGGPPYVKISWTETQSPEPIHCLDLGIPIEELK